MNSCNIAVNASYFSDRPLLKAVTSLMQLGIKKIELTGLSVTSLSEGDLSDLVKLFESEDVACVSLNAVSDLIPVNLGNLASPQQRERQAAINHGNHLIDLSVRLGCPAIVCDVGSTTEDFAQNMAADRTRDESVLVDSYTQLLEHAKPNGVSLILQPVPGRRWVPFDGYPPDGNAVVERHVWPWRKWFNAEQLLKSIKQQLGTQVSWAFDVANEVVASGTTIPDLPARLAYYLTQGLQRVYLANHPGPYHKVWHRCLLHQHLTDGLFTCDHYRAMLEQLAANQYDGEIVLLISEKSPSPEKLLQSIKFISP